MGNRRNLIVLALLMIVLGLGVLGLTAHGNPQWNRYIYIFQALVYPKHGAYIKPPANFSGTWIMWDRYGEKIAEQDYRDGKRHGKETRWENGRKLYEHHYKNDQFDGTWIYWGKNGLVSVVENWKEGKLHGTRTVYYQNGNKSFEENYNEGQLDGKDTISYENGRIMTEAYFKNGYRYGVWTTWNEKGTKEGEFNWTKEYEKGKRVRTGP